MRWHVRPLIVCAITLVMAGCSNSDRPSSTTNNAVPTGPILTCECDAPPGTGCMGDFIWDDLNCDGVQDPNEPGHEGVVVKLYECPNNILVDETTTDATGYYQLCGPAPDDYYIVVELPEGSNFSPKNVGQPDGVRDIETDSDVGPDGVGWCTNLYEGECEDAMDVGLCEPGEETGCRVTGGGVNEFGEWTGSLVDGDCARNRYTFGGQAGASTALQPQPRGEWEHNNHSGPSGRFAFHAGTASAPDGTEIDRIECSDPGYCDPARPAPAHQIDFWGVGSFHSCSGLPSIMAQYVVEGESLHWFEVNIDDSGEPGRRGHGNVNGCPSDGFGLNGSVAEVDCNCPDFYRITIHGTTDPSSPVIYQVWGYPRGGNLQIHPLTGY
jgi:hypothetical protein